MTQVPTLSSISSDISQLDSFLSLLLEPSATLKQLLVPTIFSQLQRDDPTTYSSILDQCSVFVRSWDASSKEGLIAGHPLIGEVKGLSELSSKEQGNDKRTPEAVLRRLAHLNRLYTAIYPPLPYITFVAGRPRSAIVTEMEAHLDLTPTPVPLDLGHRDLIERPDIDSTEVQAKIHERYSPQWNAELDRAVEAVWKISRARLAALSVD